jgi:hypothetical protein
MFFTILTFPTRTLRIAVGKILGGNLLRIMDAAAKGSSPLSALAKLLEIK